MTDDPPPHPALLPTGLCDLLPPEAEHEARAVARVMEVFASHGYQRVKPPLVEFADSLLAGSGAAVADQTFRLVDPESQRVLGLRADITPQVARIAATRLGGSPRPLRLCYAGQCLRVRASQIAPDRQLGQAGIELIGSTSPAADAEIVVVGAEALASIGIQRASFDLTLPPLAPALIDAAGIAGPDRAALAHALDRKDAAAVARHGGALADTLTTLLLAAGPADRALAALEAMALPKPAAQLAGELKATVAAIRTYRPDLRITIDPLEFRGLRYHTGVSMTIYTPGRTEELGRGGRYLSGEGEPATGLTLYSDALLRAARTPPARAFVYLAADADPEAAGRLRAEGYATIASLSDGEDQAARLGCTHILRGAALAPLAGA
ncbi:MAG: ATP phosphoribosyltransferase regulatory subunit [Acetobacteraceae bacterium]